MKLQAELAKKDGGTNIISTQQNHTDNHWALLRLSRQEVDAVAVTVIQSELLNNSASLPNDFLLPKMVH